MRIGYTLYPVLTLGYGKRLGVWFQGCPRRCEGCLSPELQPFGAGKECTPEEVLDQIPKGELPDGLTVSGGEPFSQPEGLLAMIRQYRKRYPGDVLVFTGYRLDELKRLDSPVVEQILGETDILVDGVYEAELDDGRGLRGSSNQVIHRFRSRERYEQAENWERKLQCIWMPECLWMVGIPPKE